jgi:exosortase/archaeosortase family protein
LLAFVAPLVWLYFLDPLSFEAMWKGRTFDLFFVWLIALELILSWEDFRETKLTKKLSLRTIGLAVALVAPTIYVWASYYLGLNQAITTWSLSNNVVGQWAESMPLSLEYLAFAAFFTIIVFLTFGKKGAIGYLLPTFFMVIVGAIYIIDNVYPYGKFTLFQAFVPTTASIAAWIFNLMGYNTTLAQPDGFTNGSMPTLTVSGPVGTASFAIAWPCAGIESLLIYTVVILLFLKRIPISWKSKVGLFTLGAVVTYFINIFRIISIFMLGMQYNGYTAQVDFFHKYYGPLYSISWILVYPIIILASLGLWHRFRTKKQAALEETAKLEEKFKKLQQ